MTDDNRISVWAPDLVIYHDKCADGIVAAWACWKRWGDAPEYLAANYGHQPPADVAGRNILIVDFSYPADDLGAMVAAGARSIVILDHHKTAQEALEPFTCWEARPGVLNPSSVSVALRDCAERGMPPIVALFDMERSGARMAWDFAMFDAKCPTPRLVELAERYDLWRFKPGTQDAAEALHLSIQAQPLTIANINMIDAEFRVGDEPVIRGQAILAWRQQLVEEIAARAELQTVAGIDGVIAVECPYSMRDAVGHYLLTAHPAAPFAAIVVTGETTVDYSLRSEGHRMDVGEVAKRMGAGGHRNAARFRVDLAAPAISEEAPNAFQNDVDRWMDACFGNPIKSDQLERADRFVQEALELAQTFPEFTADRAHALVDYVFGRAVGDQRQEVGGVMVTLAALCNAAGIAMNEAGGDELARVWTKVEAIRAKQAAKPTGSALPVASLGIEPATPLEEVSAAPEGVEALREVMDGLVSLNDLRASCGLQPLPRLQLSEPLADHETYAALEALHVITEHYVRLARSGDAGDWDPEKEVEVIRARAVLAGDHGRFLSDAVTAAAARRALGEWLAWPDAGRDGPRAVDNAKVCSWLQGIPNALSRVGAVQVEPKDTQVPDRSIGNSKSAIEALRDIASRANAHLARAEGGKA